MRNIKPNMSAKMLLWRIAVCLIGSVLLLMLGGCLPTYKAETDYMEPPEFFSSTDSSCRLNFFLVLKESEGPVVHMTVEALEVLADGLWLPVADGPLELDAAEIGTGQRLLGSVTLPPGIYQRLRFTVAKGTLPQVNGLNAVITSGPFQVEVPFTEALLAESNQSLSVLVTWDVLNSLDQNDNLSPALSATPAIRQLPVNLVYVACPEIDTVFVVRTDNNWVADSFGVKGSPAWLAIDPVQPDRMFVYTSRDRSVKIVSLSSHRVIDTFVVPLNDAPTFMTISSDGRIAYLVDERSNYVSSLDLSTGRSLARVRFTSRPRHAIYIEELDLLAVSLALSQKVVLLDPSNLRVMKTLSTVSGPNGLLFLDNRLYIAEAGDHNVSVVDLANQRGYKRLAVGLGPRRLIATDNRIYVSNYQSGSLSVLLPGQLGVIQEIGGLGLPQEMVYDQIHRRIYITDEDSSSLAIIDSNSNLLIGRVALGAKPKGLAVIQ